MPMVDAVIVATREDVEAEGLPETDGILVLAEGGSISLNDASSVAELGCGWGRNLELEAFAEILVRWHPPSTAPQFVVRDSGHVRRAFGRPDLPSFDAPAGNLLGNQFQGRFFSARRHAVALSGSLELDVFEWKVTVPAGSPAQWKRRPVLKNGPLEPTQH